MLLYLVNKNTSFYIYTSKEIIYHKVSDTIILLKVDWEG